MMAGDRYRVERQEILNSTCIHQFCTCEEFDTISSRPHTSASWDLNLYPEQHDNNLDRCIDETSVCRKRPGYTQPPMSLPKIQFCSGDLQPSPKKMYQRGSEVSTNDAIHLIVSRTRDTKVFHHRKLRTDRLSRYQLSPSHHIPLIKA